MSGVELAGLAASILQIADLGWKLSYKLYAFSRKVHEAGKNIELISQDISATGAVLKQFADELNRDEKATAGGRLSSLELIKAARGIVEECETLFKEIDASVEGGGGNKVILGLKAKLKWEVESFLGVDLNVLVYAEQIRGREAMDILQEQKNLIESFAAQKNDTAKKVEQLSKMIEQVPKSVTNTKPIQPAEQPMQQPVDDVTSFEARNVQQHKNTGTSTTRDISAVSPQNFLQVKAVKTTAADSSIMLQASESKPASTDFSTLIEEPAVSSAENVDLEHQRKLIEKLLKEVNSNRYAINGGLRYKLHDGVLKLHWQVWESLRWSRGDDVLRKLLSQNPVLARHWHECLLNERKMPVGRPHYSLGGFDVPGEMRSHTSPSNKTAEQALQAELLKEEQRDARIKLERLRAEQDALQEKGSVRSKTEEEEFDRRMWELNESDGRIRGQAKLQVRTEQTPPRDEGNLTRKFDWTAMMTNMEPAKCHYQILPSESIKAYKAIEKTINEAANGEKPSTASIADSLILQWTTVSPPPVS